MRTRHFKDMNAHIETPQAEIVGFCRRWRIAELELFGSVLRDDFSPDSDVDVLVCFDSEARPSLLDMARMQDELSRIFGRQADLVERRDSRGEPELHPTCGDTPIRRGNLCAVTMLICSTCY